MLIRCACTCVRACVCLPTNSTVLWFFCMKTGSVIFWPLTWRFLTLWRHINKIMKCGCFRLNIYRIHTTKNNMQPFLQISNYKTNLFFSHLYYTFTRDPLFSLIHLIVSHKETRALSKSQEHLSPLHNIYWAGALLSLPVALWCVLKHKPAERPLILAANILVFFCAAWQTAWRCQVWLFVGGHFH